MEERRTESPRASGATAPDCLLAIDLFADYLANELPRERCEEFVVHLKRCESCHHRLLALDLYLRVGATRDVA